MLVALVRRPGEAGNRRIAFDSSLNVIYPISLPQTNITFFGR